MRQRSSKPFVPRLLLALPALCAALWLVPTGCVTTSNGGSSSSGGNTSGGNNSEACIANKQCDCTGELCQQDCTSDNGACQFSCDATTCSNTCDGGGCQMSCDGDICELDCKGGGCNLTCGNNTSECRITGCTSMCALTCNGAATCENSCDELSGLCTKSP